MPNYTYTINESGKFNNSLSYQIVQNDTTKEFFSRLVANNNKEVWKTSETYINVESAKNAVKLLLNPQF